jgi:hypothetical protein
VGGRGGGVSPAAADGEGDGVSGVGGCGRLINVVLRPKVYEASRKALKSPFVVVEGQLQKRGQAIRVVRRRMVAVEMEIE